MEIPPEIYINIFESLDVRSLVKLSRVCRKFCDIVSYIMNNNYVSLAMTVLDPHITQVDEKYKQIVGEINLNPSLWMVLNGSHSVPKSLIFVNNVGITYSKYWMTVRDFVNYRNRYTPGLNLRFDYLCAKPFSTLENISYLDKYEISDNPIGHNIVRPDPERISVIACYGLTKSPSLECLFCHTPLSVPYADNSLNAKLQFCYVCLSSLGNHYRKFHKQTTISYCEGCNASLTVPYAPLPTLRIPPVPARNIDGYLPPLPAMVPCQICFSCATKGNY